MDKLGAYKELAAESERRLAVAGKLKNLDALPAGSRPRDALSQLADSVGSAGTAGRRWAEALFKPEGGSAVVQCKRAWEQGNGGQEFRCQLNTPTLDRLFQLESLCTANLSVPLRRTLIDQKDLICLRERGYPKNGFHTARGGW